MWSNCRWWARTEFRRRQREWVAAGRPRGQEPYWVERITREDPRVHNHVLLGRLDLDSDMLALESFKPVSPKKVPIWLTWTRLFFKGNVQSGDRPRIEQTDAIED